MKDAIENLVHQRTNDICKIIRENEEFSECDKKETELLTTLENMANEEEQKLISELNDVVNYKTAICEEVMYREAFKDGIQFYQEILKSGQKVDK